MPDQPQNGAEMAAVNYLPEPKPKRKGRALCLSGGGFRATLFHLGALRRLNELGLLHEIDTFVSVSGGSVTNGVLARRWDELKRGPAGGPSFVNFDTAVEERVRAFCRRDLRTEVLLWARATRTPWRALGFVRPASWPLTIAAGIAFGVALKIVMKSLVMPLFGAEPANPAFQYLVGNTAALARLLHRIETDPDFLTRLHRAIGRRARLFRPARERAAWKKLIAEIVPKSRSASERRRRVRRARGSPALAATA